MKKVWLRYGLASVVVGGVGFGAMLLACGDDSNVTGPDGGGDSGNPADGSGGDGSAADGGGDADAGPPHAKLTLVNAVTDLGANAAIGATGPCTDTACDGVTALRVCFAVADSLTPLPALPDTPPSFNAQLPPGIYVGTGGVFPDVGVDLSGLKITPYVMNSASLFAKGIVKPGAGNPGAGCDQLIGVDAGAGPDGGTFTENVDYWKLADIPAGTFKSGNSYALVLTGCTKDADTTLGPPGGGLPGKCGPDSTGAQFTPSGAGNPGPGNLAITIYTLDNATAVPANAIGTQFIHSSAATAQYFAGTGLSAEPGYITNQADLTDAGYHPVTGFNDGGAEAGVALYSAASTLVSVANVAVATDSFTSNPSPLAADKGSGGLDIKLPVINASTYGATPDVTFANGKAFTFIMVGDPQQTPKTFGTGPNPRLYHFLAFTNDPTVPVYKP